MQYLGWRRESGTVVRNGGFDSARATDKCFSKVPKAGRRRLKRKRMLGDGAAKLWSTDVERYEREIPSLQRGGHGRGANIMKEYYVGRLSHQSDVAIQANIDTTISNLC